jgi:hypothetical protein
MDAAAALPYLEAWVRMSRNGVFCMLDRIGVARAFEILRRFNVTIRVQEVTAKTGHRNASSPAIPITPPRFDRQQACLAGKFYLLTRAKISTQAYEPSAVRHRTEKDDYSCHCP